MSDSDSQDEYEVQAILGQKQRADGIYYLVKWRSYPMADSTWELQQNLSHCIPMIKRFEQQYHQENPQAVPGQLNSPLPRAMRLLNAAKDFYGIATAAERDFRPSSPAILYGSSDDPANNSIPSPPSNMRRLCRDQLNRATQAMRRRFQSQRVIAILDRVLDRFGRVRIQVEWSTGTVTWEPLTAATYFYPLFEAYEHRRFLESKPGPIRRPPALAHKRTHARPPPLKPIVPTPDTAVAQSIAPTPAIATPSALCTSTTRSLSPPPPNAISTATTTTMTTSVPNQIAADRGPTTSPGISPLPDDALRQQLVRNVPGAAALRFLTPVVVVPSAGTDSSDNDLICDPSAELPGWRSSLDLKPFYSGTHYLAFKGNRHRKRQRLSRKRSNSLSSSSSLSNYLTLSSDSDDLFESFFDQSPAPHLSPTPSEDEPSGLADAVRMPPRTLGHVSPCKPWTHYSVEEQDNVTRHYGHRIHCVLCTGPRERQQERELAHSLSCYKPSAKTRAAMQRPAHFLVCQVCQAPFHSACVLRLAAASQASSAPLATDADLPNHSPWSLVNAQLQRALDDALPLFDRQDALTLKVDTWKCLFCRAQWQAGGGIIAATTDTGLTSAHTCQVLSPSNVVAPPTSPTTAGTETLHTTQTLLPGPWYLISLTPTGYRDLVWVPYGWMAHVAWSKIRGFERRRGAMVPCVEGTWRKYLTTTATPADPFAKQFLALQTEMCGASAGTVPQSSDWLAKGTATCCLLHQLLQQWYLRVTDRRICTLRSPSEERNSFKYAFLRAQPILNPLLYLMDQPALQPWFDQTSIQPDYLRLERVLDMEIRALAPNELRDIPLASTGRQYMALTRVYVKWRGLPYSDATWIPALTRGDAQYRVYLDCVSSFWHRINAFSPESARYQPSWYTLPPNARRQHPLPSFHEFAHQPAFLKHGKLLPYQLDGLNWLCYQWHQRRSSILADEMGLGKTIQVIAFLSALFHQPTSDPGTSPPRSPHAPGPRVYPFLIVVPNSVLSNWVMEFKVWAPELIVVPYHGNADSCHLIDRYEFHQPPLTPQGLDYWLASRAQSSALGSSRERLNCHVVVTTYEMAMNHRTRLASLVSVWPCLVVDEGHRLKNDESKLFHELHRINAEQIVLLTGTPLQNNLRELFNLMSFVDRDRFGDVASLEAKYQSLTQDLIPKLHDLLKPYFLRRTKAEVLGDVVPAKIEVIIPVGMTPLQKSLYKATLGRNYALLSTITKQIAHLQQKQAEGANAGAGSQALGAKPSGPSRMSLHNILMTLRQLMGHPYILPDVEPDLSDCQAMHRHLIEASAKLKLLHTMLPILRARGHRVLIFSQMTRILDILEDYLVGEQMQYLRLDGSTKASERQRRVTLFNAPDSPYFVFLLTTRAGGVGLNLTAADVVIIYDVDFNPHADLQAICRAHRIGQTKRVMAFKLVTRGSAEERIVQVGKQKMVMDHLIIEKMDQEVLDTVDIEGILQYGAQALFAEDTPGEADQLKAVKSIEYSAQDIQTLLDKTTQEMVDAEEAAKRTPNAPTSASRSTTNTFSFAKIWVQEAQEGATGSLAPVDELLQNHTAAAQSPALDEQFWDRLLGDQHLNELERQKAHQAQYGRGHRVTKKVNYAQFDHPMSKPAKTTPVTSKPSAPQPLDATPVPIAVASRLSNSHGNDASAPLKPAPRPTTTADPSVQANHIKFFAWLQQYQKTQQATTQPVSTLQTPAVSSPAAAAVTPSQLFHSSQITGSPAQASASNQPYQASIPNIPRDFALPRRASSQLKRGGTKLPLKDTLVQWMAAQQQQQRAPAPVPASTTSAMAPMHAPSTSTTPAEIARPQLPVARLPLLPIVPKEAAAAQPLTWVPPQPAPAAQPVPTQASAASECDLVEPPDLLNFYNEAIQLIRRGHQFSQPTLPCPACGSRHVLACPLIFRRDFIKKIQRMFYQQQSLGRSSGFRGFCDWYRAQYGLYLAYMYHANPPLLAQASPPAPASAMLVNTGVLSVTPGQPVALPHNYPRPLLSSYSTAHAQSWLPPPGSSTGGPVHAHRMSPQTYGVYGPTPTPSLSMPPQPQPLSPAFGYPSPQPHPPSGFFEATSAPLVAIQSRAPIRLAIVEVSSSETTPPAASAPTPTTAAVPVSSDSVEALLKRLHSKGSNCLLCGAVFATDDAGGALPHLPRDCPFRLNLEKLEQRVQAVQQSTTLSKVERSQCLSTLNIYIDEARLCAQRNS